VKNVAIPRTLTNPGHSQQQKTGQIWLKAGFPASQRDTASRKIDTKMSLGKIKSL
jgi:hypothetical protein